MSTRTTLTSVTFTRPFTLSAVDGLQPAGTFQVVTERERLEGLSFGAFMQTATMLLLPADPLPGQTRQIVPIDPDELSALLAADKVEDSTTL